MAPGYAVNDQFIGVLMPFLQNHPESLEGDASIHPEVSASMRTRVIADSAFSYQRVVEKGERTVIGLNAFVEAEETDVELWEADPGFEDEKVRNLTELKKNRDQALVKALLKDVREVGQGSDNIMPALIKAVKSSVTLGEIIGVMKDVFGEYREESIY